MKKNKYFLFLFVLAALLVTSQAHAAILYGHDNTDLEGGELYRIDTVAQTVTLVGADAARAYSGPDIQMSPDNLTIYMSRAGWDDTSLFLIDPTTGSNTGTLSLSGFPTYIDRYNNLRLTDTATALEFVGETLYASFHESGPEFYDGILGTIDLSTGAITTIGEMTAMNRPTGGLMYVAGTMYAVSSTDNNDSRLFTVNLSTGAAERVGNLTLGGMPQEGATALAYADGTMYTLLTDRFDTNLYSVDLSTGALTLEFDLGFEMNSLTLEFDLGFEMNSLTSSPRTLFALKIEKAEIEFRHRPSSDKYNVKGKATVLETSDGIDPLGEDVSVTVGTSSLTIPAGSFEERGAKYEFHGIIDGVKVKMKIKEVDIDIIEFDVKAKGVDLFGTTNPVDIYLLIGSAEWGDSIRLSGKLKLKDRGGDDDNDDQDDD